MNILNTVLLIMILLELITEFVFDLTGYWDRKKGLRKKEENDE
jgi:hypothetical protein